MKSLRHDMVNTDGDSLGAEWDFQNGLNGGNNFADINASLQVRDIAACDRPTHVLTTLACVVSCGDHQTILAVTNDDSVEFTYIQVDRERQQLIHNTGAPGLVLTLLKQGSSMLVNRQNADCEISEFVSELFHIFAHCYRFMRTYTWENHEYLEELGAQVGLLTHLVSQQVFGAELLAQVLAANQSLLKHASESYMRRLVDHICMQGKVTSSGLHSAVLPTADGPLIALTHADVWCTGCVSCSSDAPGRWPTAASSGVGVGRARAPGRTR